jgi:hypothetical protein
LRNGKQRWRHTKPSSRNALYDEVVILVNRQKAEYGDPFEATAPSDRPGRRRMRPN